ncbi:MAG: TonB family protein [Cyclobacteriaceae bacterium]|nr:TonB family protein [Cyclobacteriaceae bacterium]
MKKKPEVSDSEILHFMDFDTLLREHANVVQANRNKTLIKKSLLTVGGIVLIALLWYSASDNPTPELEPSELQQATSQDAPEPSAPVEYEPVPLSDDGKSVEQQENNSKQSKPAAKLQTEIQEEEEKTSVQPEPVYQQASPVNGYGALYQYFSTALQYPSHAVADSVQGIVTVTFIINLSGKPEKITIESSPDEKLNAEAIRLIENMPLWSPATLNGNPVPSKLSLPITFQLISVKSQQ